MAHAYATTNLLTALTATSACTWAAGNASTRARLNDGYLDRLDGPGSASGGTSIVIDLGSAQNVSVVAILNSNIASATSPTIVVEGADNSGISTNVFSAKAATTPATTAPRQKDHALQFASTSRRYWRITWAWTGTFALTVGEFFMGVSTALTRTTVWGPGEAEGYRVTRFETGSGDVRSHFIAGPVRSRTVTFEDLDETERNEVLAMWRASRGGATKTLWLEQQEAVSTAATAAYQDCIFGRFEAENMTWAAPDFGLYAPDSLTIRSLAREVGS